MLFLLPSLWASLFIFTVTADYQSPEPSTNCDCFKTVSGAVYVEQVTFDFRNGKPNGFDAFFAPLNVDNYGGNTVKNAMSSSQISYANNQMTLLASKTNGQQHSADLESKNKVFHGSFRARYALVSGGTGGDGACSGFFTFLDGGGNEADIEILTSEPHNKVHYTGHLDNGVENPTLVPTISADWSQPVTHRFDWEDGHLGFWANGNPTGSLDKGVPTQPSTLCLNMWSSGKGWGGEMKEGGKVSMNVQWMQAFYNGTASGGRRGCSKVCYVN